MMKSALDLKSSVYHKCKIFLGELCGIADYDDSADDLF